MDSSLLVSQQAYRTEVTDLHVIGSTTMQDSWRHCSTHKAMGRHSHRLQANVALALSSLDFAWVSKFCVSISTQATSLKATHGEHSLSKNPSVPFSVLAISNHSQHSQLRGHVLHEISTAMWFCSAQNEVNLHSRNPSIQSRLTLLQDVKTVEFGKLHFLNLYRPEKELDYGHLSATDIEVEGGHQMALCISPLAWPPIS